MFVTLKTRITGALAACVARPSPEPTAPPRAQSRAELERMASTVLGADYDFVGLTDREVHERAIAAAVLPSGFSSWRKSDDWVRRAFEDVIRRRAADGALPTPAAEACACDVAPAPVAPPAAHTFAFSSHEDESETDPNRGFSDDLATRGGAFTGVEIRT